MRQCSTPSILISFALVALVAVLFHEPEARLKVAIGTAEPVETSPALTAPTTARTSRVSLTRDASTPSPPLSPGAHPGTQREYTRVLEGETLLDVSQRVYGTREHRNTLWRSNRDQLDRPDSSLREGTVLRTPCVD